MARTDAWGESQSVLLRAEAWKWCWSHCHLGEITYSQRVFCTMKEAEMALCGYLAALKGLL